MYDELVKRLRERSVFLFPHHGESRSYDADLMHEAADAIEELSKLVDESIPKDDAEIIIAEVAKPRWIPVTERLPEEHGWYLCAVKSFFGKGSFVDACKYDGHYFVQDGLATERVTHWMPLPEPPKEEAT